MEFSKITFGEASTLVDLEEIINPLLNGGYGLGDFYEYLKGVDLYTTSKPFQGFLSCEVVGDSVEVHAFFDKSDRPNSIRVLKSFRDFILNHTKCKSILTSVTSDYEYIVRVLGFIGFKPIETIKNDVHKRSGTFDITYLKYEV